MNKIFADSDAAEQLETEKKTARSRGEARRRKFQAQDSVLNESINASQAWSDKIKKFSFNLKNIIFTGWRLREVMDREKISLFYKSQLLYLQYLSL